MTFAGSPERLEARLVPEAGFEFDAFRVSGLPRRPGVALVRALLMGVGALRACGRILARRRPDVVLGGGGYVAGPMVAAAARRRIPAALMEADAHLGLANRLAAPFASRVFLAFPIAGRDGDKYRVTGRPLPARSRPRSGPAARLLFGLPPDGRALLVFGGSQGARTLNELSIDAWAEAGPPVLHLAGERDFERLCTRVRRDDYRLLAWTDDVGAALAAVDLVIARAGGSVWEVAAAGKPAILVPYPHATAGHQQANAQHFARTGGALVVRDERARELVAPLAEELLGDETRLAAMGAAMTAAARPRAGPEIAEELIRLAAA